MKISFEKIRTTKLTKNEKLRIPFMVAIIAIPPLILAYWSMWSESNEMSLLLITKRGTGKRLVDEKINYNWAGSEFKNFQEERKNKVLFKSEKTIMSSVRGTQVKYLEKSKEITSKPKQAYITINRGTKRVLIDLKWKQKK